jgi:hypothetical protein
MGAGKWLRSQLADPHLVFQVEAFRHIAGTGSLKNRPETQSRPKDPWFWIGSSRQSGFSRSASSPANGDFNQPLFRHLLDPAPRKLILSLFISEAAGA